MESECYEITLILNGDFEEGFTVTCKELPELVTEGRTIYEAIENSKDALIATLELYEDFNRELPDSIKLDKRTKKASKKKLDISVTTTHEINFHQSLV